MHKRLQPRPQNSARSIFSASRVVVALALIAPRLGLAQTAGAEAPALAACQSRQTALFGLCRTDGTTAPPVAAQRFFFIGAAGMGAERDLFPARLKPTDPMGFIDATGRWVIEPRFSQAMRFTEGLAVVSDGGRSAAIDRKGATVVPWFDGLMYPFSQGLACVVPGGSIHLNLPGRLREKLFGPAGDDVYTSPWWRLEGKVGFVDATGRMAISPRFEPKLNFLKGGCGFSATGYAAMRQDGQEGLIDRTGQWVVEPQFQYLGIVFSGNRKVVALIADRLEHAGVILDTVERLDGRLVAGEPVRWRETGAPQETLIGGGLGRALVNQLLFPQWQRDLLNDDVSSRTLAAWTGSLALGVVAMAALLRRMRRRAVPVRWAVGLLAGTVVVGVTFLAGAISLYSTAVLLAAAAIWMMVRWRRGRGRRQLD
ncbi:hypothetical protein GN316_03255 [Xylophilus sp. Kf1]|nr:hypothetical protein [Xylophilus sp. Kf1]